MASILERVDHGVGPFSYESFPLLRDSSTYRPYSFPFICGEDHSPKVSYKQWIDMFRSSVSGIAKQAKNSSSSPHAQTQANEFECQYKAILDKLENNSLAKIGQKELEDANCITLCQLREQTLQKNGFGDIYSEIKSKENSSALELLPSILRELDTSLPPSLANSRQRFEKLLQGVFAGNIFDLGAAASTKLFEESGATFEKTRASLLPRPWAVDDLEEMLERLGTHKYKKAIIFVDNAGSDVILGILPFARELLSKGTQVILTANSIPSINDITAKELEEIVSRASKIDTIFQRAFLEETLKIVPSGNDLPVIDLRKISGELARASQDADLVVLEGMGRSIETNLYAELSCDRLNLGMIKHPEVATMLGGRLYDCVCKFTSGQS